MRLYLLFNSRSSVTGRALASILEQRTIPVDLETDLVLSPVLDPAIRVLKTSMGTTGRNCDIAVRWGNSTTNLPNVPSLELNTRESVRNATDKGVMMRMLVDAGVPTPTVFFRDTVRDGDIPDGPLYIRGASDHVSYSSNGSIPRGNWKYASIPVNRAAEFRVHVFNGKVLGVYEKRPQEANARILKDDNCDFVRLNMANRENAQYARGVRPIAKRAVRALGLLFGGCDIIKDTNGNCFVLEVNSAPALNGPNLIRWSNAINEFILNPVINTEDDEENNTSGRGDNVHNQENVRPANPTRQDRNGQEQVNTAQRGGRTQAEEQVQVADRPGERRWEQDRNREETPNNPSPIPGRAFMAERNDEAPQGVALRANGRMVVRVEFPIEMFTDRDFSSSLMRLVAVSGGSIHAEE